MDGDYIFSLGAGDTEVKTLLPSEFKMLLTMIRSQENVASSGYVLALSSRMVGHLEVGKSGPESSDES
jgi:hypothetical protein